MKTYKVYFRGNDVAKKETIVVIVKAENEREAEKLATREVWVDFVEEIDDEEKL